MQFLSHSRLQLQNRTCKPGAIFSAICRRDIAGVSNMFETWCNFGATKIASSCRDKNRLCKRALCLWVCLCLPLSCYDTIVSSWKIRQWDTLRHVHHIGTITVAQISFYRFLDLVTPALCALVIKCRCGDEDNSHLCVICQQSQFVRW